MLHAHWEPSRPAHLSAELTGASTASSLACARAWCWDMLASVVYCPSMSPIVAMDAWAGVNAFSAGDDPGDGGLKIGRVSIPDPTAGEPMFPNDALARPRTSMANKGMASAAAAAVAGETVALPAAAGPDAAAGALREEERRGETGPVQYCPLLSMAKRPRSADMLRSRVVDNIYAKRSKNSGPKNRSRNRAHNLFPYAPGPPHAPNRPQTPTNRAARTRKPLKAQEAPPRSVKHRSEPQTRRLRGHPEFPKTAPQSYKFGGVDLCCAI